jgi:hypothetical protein
MWLIRRGFPAHFRQNRKRPDPGRRILKPEPSPMLQLEFHQLDRRLESLRVRHPARQWRLIASLAESGQQTPIIVSESAGRYLVIDGHKRIAALQQLGRDTVDAVVWDMSEAEALVLERIAAPERAGDGAGTRLAAGGDGEPAGLLDRRTRPAF